jgi:hypothetical protein
MLTVPAAVVTQIDARIGIVVRNLCWIVAKNRETNEPETIGIWNGADVRNFVIDGETRTYYGAGSFLSFGTLTSETGVVIRKLTGTASPLSDEVKAALRLYDPKMAPVEVHLAFFSPDTMQLLADPIRRFKGWIDTMPVKTPSSGGQSYVTLNLVGNTRLLTRKTNSRRSNESQSRRKQNDKFFNDVTLTGTVQTPWGSKSTGTIMTPSTTSNTLLNNVLRSTKVL